MTENSQNRLLLKKLIEEQVEAELKLLREYEDPLAQVFLQPFKDIVDTARHGLEKTSTSAWGNAWKLAKQTLTLFLPGVPVDAFTSGMDKKIKSHMDQIDGKYRDVIQRNYDMMRARDLWGIPFLLNPALMTGVGMATKAPEIALAGLEAVTGGHPTIAKMRERLHTINSRVTGGGLDYAKGAGNVGGGGDGGDAGLSFEGIQNRRNDTRKPLKEQQAAPTQDEVNKALASQIERAGKHPKIQSAIQNSPVAQQMKQIAEMSLVETVKDAIAFNTYDEMKSKMGSKFAETEKQVMAQLPQGATPQQTKEFQDALVTEMKGLIKQMYIKQLEKLLSQSPELKADLSRISKQIQAL